MNKIKKIVLLSILACLYTSAFAEEAAGISAEEHTARKYGLNSLKLLYLNSPESPWHTFLFNEDGAIPEAVAETLDVESTSLSHREAEILTLSVFAAYFKTFGDEGLLAAFDHIEKIVEQDDTFSPVEKKSLPTDIVNAVQELVTQPFSPFVTPYLQDSVCEMPWLLDGSPEPMDPDAAALELYAGTTENEASAKEDVTCDEGICHEEPTLSDEKPKRTLRQHWNDEVRPHLKKAAKKIEDIVKEVVGQEKGQKIIEKTQKMVQAVEKEAKPIVHEVEKAFKKLKKKW